MYIEDMEAVALHSCSGPVGNLEDSTILEPLSSSECIVVDVPPPFTLEHYPSLPLSSSSPSLSSTPPLSPPGSTVPMPTCWLEPPLGIEQILQARNFNITGTSYFWNGFIRIIE